MRTSIAASLLAVGSARAFSDSSPFILFSTANFASQPRGDQLQTSSQVLTSARELLISCPTNHYLLVSQPNIHATDLHAPSGCRSANLCRALESHSVQGQFTVAETIGSLSFDDFSDYIRATCMENGRHATVQEHQLKSLPTAKGKKERAVAVDDNDHELGQLLQKYQAYDDYTVVYFSNPNEFKPYEAEFADPVHVELRREVARPPAVARRAGEESDKRPLFEKYQFFTPGIFMGLVAAFVMLSIVYVGLSALSSLQVSYGAFEKEMGPAAQKKQQ